MAEERVQNENVLSDIHISNSYELKQNCQDSNDAVSRFVFKLPEGFAETGEQDIGFSEETKEESAECFMDEDGDMIVSRRSINQDAVDHCEVLTINHRLETQLKDVGQQVWSGCLLMCDFMLHYRDMWKDCTILDLGAGVGLTSIIAAMLGVKVFCTDKGEDILSMASENVESNSHLLPGDGKNVNVRQLDWIESAQAGTILGFSSAEINQISTIIAAEVIYDIELTEAFFSLVSLLVKNAPKVVYISLEKRLVFTVEDLDIVSPAYSHFKQCLEELVKCENGEVIVQYSQIPCDFPQYFQYKRVKELEIWKIEAWQKLVKDSETIT